MKHLIKFECDVVFHFSKHRRRRRCARSLTPVLRRGPVCGYHSITVTSFSITRELFPHSLLRFFTVISFSSPIGYWQNLPHLCTYFLLPLLPIVVPLHYCGRRRIFSHSLPRTLFELESSPVGRSDWAVIIISIIIMAGCCLLGSSLPQPS